MTSRRDEDKNEQGDVETLPRTRKVTKTPRVYKVVLLNDDYTTMDFVVSILESVFFKSPAEAMQIMMRVHRAGRGVCGTYPKEIAEAKVTAVHDRAAEAGYPLRAVLEEE